MHEIDEFGCERVLPIDNVMNVVGGDGGCIALFDINQLIRGHVTTDAVDVIQVIVAPKLGKRDVVDVSTA